MKTSAFDYDLPPGLIAQHPPPERTDARMMIVRRAPGTIEHAAVTDLPLVLRAGDLLVVNDTRVIPARLHGTKTDSLGHAEILLLEEIEPGKWTALCRMSGRVRPGMRLELAGGKIAAAILAVNPGGEIVISVTSARPVLEILDEEGLTPLPPYIRRPHGPVAGDRARYQTVYANAPGAVAAPTAGLHFTDELLAELAGHGILRANVTLHVGAGTFKPVKSENVEEHVMDFERYSVPENTAELVCRTRKGGGRVVAVGTTTVRVLETAAAGNWGRVEPCRGRTNLFIRQPFQFRAVDAILTNFHLPKSTLLMMICAFAGRELILRAYNEAVARRYRFYSYGDCMLIT